MKAFAIFAGGGVKGAAFPGCLKATEEKNIEFVGYGGTSAGSIVALLTSVGYSSDELKQILVDHPFTDLLDEPVEDLRTLRSIPRMFEKSMYGAAISLWWNHVELLEKLKLRLGLNGGAVMKAFLQQKIRNKFPELHDVQNITFRHLAEVGCPDLKILTSDLVSRRPLIYSVDNHPEAYVVDIVRASMSYPFVFEPVIFGDRRLVDGGLSCNLPLSLFYRERRSTNVPVIAFDVLSAPEAPPHTYGISHYLGDMTATALESSESLLWEIVEGVYHVAIDAPAGIHTLDFELSQEDRQRLYDQGLNTTKKFGPSTRRTR
jgi:NTE family protein